MDTLACREFKFSSDTGEVSGYGAIFNNIDKGLDRIQRGAFKKTLKGKANLPMLFSHDQARPIGVWSELKEDSHGLAVAGRISNTTTGQDVRTLAKDGAVTGLSIGYWPTKADYVDDVRVLKEIELIEVSVVAIPMNDLARISGIKSALGRGDQVSREDYEFLLRNTGLSRRKVKRLLDHGFAALSKQSQMVEALNCLAAKLEEF